MVEDYIKIPEWVEDIERIFSLNFISSGMKEFVHESKVKMDFLRGVYTVDRELFIDIIDEMSIRGFEFFPVKESNLFPKKTYDKCSYIMSDHRSDINKLDFEKFDIGTFISRFSVYVENFFDFVPIEGFLNLNPKMNINEFELMFKLAGFKIIEYEKINFEETEETEVGLLDSMFNLDEKSLKKVELESVFCGGIFNNLQKFFRTNNIENLDQIDIDVINSYARFGGAGKVKIEALQKKLIHIVHSNELKSLKKMDLYGLKYWFLGNFSIPFIEKCHSENIFSIIDVSEDIIREYSPIFGYSKGQLKELMDTLKMAKESLEQILHEGEKISFQNINSVTKHKCIRLDSIIPSSSFKVVHNYFNEANIIYLA